MPALFIQGIHFHAVIPIYIIDGITQEEIMESIQRSILLLHPGDGPYAHPQSRGMLKLQATAGGLAASLTVNGLPAGGFMLYLFLEDGAAIFAGDVTGGGLRRTLPGIRLQSVWGAAVIHSPSLAFCLKSVGVDWKDAMMRFKLLHAPRPAWPAAPSEPSVMMNTEYSEYEEELPENIPQDIDAAPTVESPFVSADLPQQGSLLQNEYEAEPVYDDEPMDFEPSAPWQPEPAIQEEDVEDDMDPCRSCPHVSKQERINPFPLVFPQSEWTKLSYPGPTGWWHYITGRIYSGSQIVAKAVGVPGEYGMMPPVWLEGFGTYLRCVTPDAHGYWLMFQDAETGEILDMGLSPRDA
jgi:hypothetical protein